MLKFKQSLINCPISVPIESDVVPEGGPVGFGRRRETPGNRGHPRVHLLFLLSVAVDADVEWPVKDDRIRADVRAVVDLAEEELRADVHPSFDVTASNTWNIQDT